jgi:hypothetical protein
MYVSRRYDLLSGPVFVCVERQVASVVVQPVTWFVALYWESAVYVVS